MDYTDFVVDRAQHMRPLEYDLSEKYNGLLRYLNDMGILSNLPVGTIGPAEIISASDAISAPLRSLVVGGNSVQTGTPTPSVPVSIQSVVNPVLHFAGKNLGSAGNLSFTRLVSMTFPALPAGTYTLSAEVTGSDTSTSTCGFQVRYTDGVYLGLNQITKGGRNSVTFTAARPFNYVILYASTNNATSAGMTATWSNIQLELGSTATAYEPYEGTSVTLPITLRGLPDGTRDSATYTYLRPSEREGFAWYGGSLVRKTGQTTQAATEGITGTVGVDVLSSTGEIADGPTVIYKIAAPTTEQLAEIELPNAFGPSFTLWGTADATPQLTAQYIRDISAAINDMQEAIADL